jgi:hypothetical protein
MTPPSWDGQPPIDLPGSITAGKVTPADAQTLWKTVTFINRWVELSDKFVVEFRRARPASLLAETVALSPWHVSTAELRFLASSDHLTGVTSIVLSGRLPGLAPYALFRAALESTAKAAWLIDPRVSSVERLARFQTDRLTNVQNQLKHMSKTASARPKLEQRISVILTQAAAHGLQGSFDRRGRLNGVGAPAPLITDLIDDLLGPRNEPEEEAFGRGLYHSLSVRAHAEQAGLLAGGQTGSPAGPGETWMKLFELDPNHLWRTTDAVLSAFELALLRLGVLGGLDHDEWLELHSQLVAPI